MDEQGSTTFKKSSQEMDNLLVYLEQEWSAKSKNDFILKLDKSVKQIQKHPESLSESVKMKGLRKCVVTKQTSFYYNYSDTSINIAALFDNRQNPGSRFEDSDI